MKAHAFLLLIALGFASNQAYAKRGEPKAVQPITFEGIKYSAPQGRGLTERPPGQQDGPGYIQANDLKTGKLLWQLRVYEIKLNEEIESDVQDIFITSLKIVDGQLHVWNEKKDHFVLDLAQRKVIEGANQVYFYASAGESPGSAEELTQQSLLLPLGLLLAVGLAAAWYFRRH